MSSHTWDDKNKEPSVGYDVWLGSSPAERALMDKSGYHCSNEGRYICRSINSTEREVIIPILSACHAALGVASSSGSHN